MPTEIDILQDEYDKKRQKLLQEYDRTRAVLRDEFSKEIAPMLKTLLEKLHTIPEVDRNSVLNSEENKVVFLECMRYFMRYC